MVREWILTLLGVTVGYMFIGWSTYMLVQRARLSPEERARTRVPLGLVVLILIIGLADAAKATTDLVRLVWQ